MQAIKSILTLALSVLTSSAFATIVPITNEVVEASLKSEARDYYVDGYVQVNKTKGTISLVLQPVMPPCPMGHSCPEVMPAPQDYFLEAVKVAKDECDAVIYQAEQTLDHSIRVRVVDNTQYDYGNCPTFLPLPETVVQIEQIFYGPNSTEEKDEYFAAEALAPIRY